MPVQNKSIKYFTAVENLSAPQDTLIHKKYNIDIKDSSSKVLIKTNPIKGIDLQAIDSILKRSEERQNQIALEKQQKLINKPVYIRKIDTTELLYKQFGIASFPLKEKFDIDPIQQNFLYNFSSIKPKEKNKGEVFTYLDNETNYQTIKPHNEIVKSKLIKQRMQFDWLTILLIVSFLLLGWVRMFNKKYLASIFKAVLSYKESNTLYREKNSLMSRASFIINALFISNISVFVMHIKKFYSIDIGNFDENIIYLIVFVSLIALYILRAISSGFIGFVFLKQKVFSEYFHNVNIYTKSIGLIMFPLVVMLQFVSYKYIESIIYMGISIVGLIYLLQQLRAFQTFISNNVSILYMILYLCAFEIIPFLIIFKLLLHQ